MLCMLCATLYTSWQATELLCLLMDLTRSLHAMAMLKVQSLQYGTANCTACLCLCRHMCIRRPLQVHPPSGLPATQAQQQGLPAEARGERMIFPCLPVAGGHHNLLWLLLS